MEMNMQQSVLAEIAKGQKKRSIFRSRNSNIENVDA